MKKILLLCLLLLLWGITFLAMYICWFDLWGDGQWYRYFLEVIFFAIGIGDIVLIQTLKKQKLILAICGILYAASTVFMTDAVFNCCPNGLDFLTFGLSLIGVFFCICKLCVKGTTD